VSAIFFFLELLTQKYTCARGGNYFTFFFVLDSIQLICSCLD